MVIIASHTAGGNLTVFLPRKHPRLCPRSLTTWMAAKLSSSYYNHLITEAPPCALPVFFFFFFTSIFTGLLWDVLHNQQSYSHERMHWDNLLFKMMSSWQRQSRSGSNRRALDTEKKHKKKTIVLLPVQEFFLRVLLPKRTRWCFCFGARHQKRSWPSQFEPLSWEK